MAISAGTNPYSAPKSQVDDVSDSANPEADEIRRKYLSHETAIKSVGSLYYLGGFFSAIGLVGLLWFLFGSSKTPDDEALGSMVILAVFCVPLLWLARGLRKLRPWARIPTAILAGIGLLGFPFGTLINGYIMWLVLSKKGAYVLSPEYAEIVEATPHIKSKTSIIVWIFLILLLALIAFAAISALMK